MRKVFILFLFSIINCNYLFAQCCAAGGASPIAGGASAGVLLEHQVEINSNYQYVSTTKFLNGHKDTANFLDRFYSNYQNLRLGYGVTKDFTIYLEGGYYFNKTQIGINKRDTMYSKGISDLIIFPRYDIINRSTAAKRIELTLGMGMKIPLGKYNDSTLVYHNPQTGQKVFTTSPLSVQPTNGANDFIFYGFFYRGFPLKNFRVFSSALYVKKGTNPLGQQFGNYASLSLFIGKTFYKKLGVTLQINGEWIDKMKSNRNIDLLALYNVYADMTGSKKVFFVPQISYSYQSFTLFVASDIPLYQYVNKVQIASQYLITAGLSYKFMASKPTIKSGTYYCPMHPKVTSLTPGKCHQCDMDLELKK